MSSPGLAGGGTWTWTYDEAGRQWTEAASVPGTTSTRTYNNDDTIATQVLVKGSTTLADWRYGYDNNSRITSQDLHTAAGAGTPAMTGVFTYHYNNAGRVDTFTDTLNGAARSRTLAWDADGNRIGYGATPASCRSATVVTVANTQCTWFNADDSPKAVTDPNGTPTTNTSTYDNVGRLLNDSCSSETYDGFDRTILESLTASVACGRTAATTVSYAYDGLDRQRQHVETTSGVATTTNVNFDGLTKQMLADFGTAKKALEGVYVLDPAGAPKAVDAGTAATNEFLNDDGTGNISSIVGPLGTVTCDARFDPFGTPEGIVTADPDHICNSGTNPRNEIFYRGARHDATTGQYQFGSRTYDPAKGVFLTPDSYRAASGATDLSVGVDPLTMNRYSYVNGDPINLVDPTGHFQCSNKIASRCFQEANGPPPTYDAKKAWQLMYGGKEFEWYRKSVKEYLARHKGDKHFALPLGFQNWSPKQQQSYLQKDWEHEVGVAFSKCSLACHLTILATSAFYGDPSDNASSEAISADADLVASRQAFDPQAHALAQRIGGRAQVEFANGAYDGREFDAVSDEYVAQSKPSDFTLGSRFRAQAKATFQAAVDSGRTPYFHFEGSPDPSVLELCNGTPSSSESSR